MANTKNVILNLPFDESDGPLIAYDRSVNHMDSIVSGAKSVSGKIGNVIQFSGKDTRKISKNVSNPSGEFLILCWVNPMSIEAGSLPKVIWLLASDGIDQYSEILIKLSCGNWVSVAMIKRGAQHNFYVDTALVKIISRSGTLSDVSLNQDYFGGEYGKGCVDDMKLYNIAPSQEDLIEEMLNIKQLTYYVDGVDLKEYGLYVSSSDGLTDRSKMKSPMSVSWDNYHGTCVDLNHRFYESRGIILSCFIKAVKGKGDFASKVNRFFQIFDKASTHCPMVDIHPTKPLVYEVYSGDAIAIKKTRDDSLMVGTFTLKLKGPSPVRKVLEFTCVGESTQNYSIKITTTKPVDICWGDGEVQTDIYGEDLAVNHIFKSNGDHYVIVAGCIDEIEKFEINATVVRNKL